MIKTYINIDLHDEGRFHSTLKPSDLDLRINVEVVNGSFNDIDFKFNTIDTYTPTHGDKLYFLPGVTVPRVKLKDLANDYKIKTVRDLDTANIVVVGSKTVDKMTDYKWSYFAETHLVKEFLETAVKNNHLSEFEYSKVKEMIDVYDEDIFLIQYSSIRLLCNEAVPYHIVSNGCKSSKKLIKVLDEHKDLFDTISKRELYIEDALYDHINGPDAVTIDDGMYQVLQEMLTSSDRENKILAMEIMANCDYKSSITKLCFLFNKFGNSLYDMREKNHVNFKSLTLYMGGSLFIHLDDMVDLMIEKNLLTSEYYLEICEEYKDDICDNGTLKHFHFKQICSSPEVEKALNQEVIYQVKPANETIINLQNDYTNPKLDFI